MAAAEEIKNPTQGMMIVAPNIATATAARRRIDPCSGGNETSRRQARANNSREKNAIAAAMASGKT